MDFKLDVARVVFRNFDGQRTSVRLRSVTQVPADFLASDLYLLDIEEAGVQDDLAARFV
jgi:hypothetical protein